MCFVGVIMFTN